MGLEQKKAVAKAPRTKVDKTSKADADRSNVAEVIKRLKQMAATGELSSTRWVWRNLERLEAIERVAASVDAALAPMAIEARFRRVVADRRDADRRVPGAP